MAVDSAILPSAANAQTADLPLRTMQTTGIDSTASVEAGRARAAEASHQLPPATSARGMSVTLAVPLDGEDNAVGAPKKHATTTVHGTRKLLRRDSLDRREAVLRGKEGSRARRRWENDRLLNNPHAEPPLPSDWEIRPTYPRRTIPYYLAPLWDAAEFQRAIESKLNDKRRRRHNQQQRTRHNRHGKNNGSVSSSSLTTFNAGFSPMEEAASNIPKEIRARLKHARSAKGLLQDLEEDVRSFVRCWNERELKLREDGLGDAPLPLPRSLALRLKQDRQQQTETEIEVGESRQQGRHRHHHQHAAVFVDEEDEEEDEEIVFVGRNGAMHDMPPSPNVRSEKSSTAQQFQNSLDESDDTRMATSPADAATADDDGEKIDHPTDSLSTITTEKLIFQALESDKGAGFARWLVHCVGSYYGLRTWSVTRDVEGQLRREAYVGIDSRARGWMGLGRCVDLGDRKEVELPQPLWGMV